MRVRVRAACVRVRPLRSCAVYPCRFTVNLCLACSLSLSCVSLPPCFSFTHKLTLSRNKYLQTKSCRKTCSGQISAVAIQRTKKYADLVHTPPKKQISCTPGRLCVCGLLPPADIRMVMRNDKTGEKKETCHETCHEAGLSPGRRPGPPSWK